MVSLGKPKISDFKTPRLQELFGKRYWSNYAMLYELYDDVGFDHQKVMDIWDLDLSIHMSQEDKGILWKAIGDIPISDREIKSLIYTLFEFGALNGSTYRKAKQAFGYYPTTIL